MPVTCARRRSSRPPRSRYKIYIIDEAHMVSSAGLQRPAQDRRGAAGAPQVHLRHHRAREGHRHHPLAHPPLSVPAGAARADCRTTSPSCASAKGITVERRAAARGARRRRLGARLAVRAGPADGRRRTEGGVTYRLASALLGLHRRDAAGRHRRRRLRGRRRGRRFRDRRPGDRGGLRPEAVRRRPARAAARLDHPGRRARRGPGVLIDVPADAGERMRRRRPASAVRSSPAPPTSSTPA